MVANKELLQFATDHQPHKRGVIDLAPRQLAGIPPVAQHGHPIGDLLHLGQAVRDVQNAHARAAQVVDHGE